MKNTNTRIIYRLALAIFSLWCLGFTEYAYANPVDEINEDGSGTLVLWSEEASETLIVHACFAPSMGCSVDAWQFAQMADGRSVSHSFTWNGVEYFTICGVQLPCVTLTYDIMQETINIHTQICSDGWCGDVIDVYTTR